MDEWVCGMYVFRCILRESFLFKLKKDSSRIFQSRLVNRDDDAAAQRFNANICHQIESIFLDYFEYKKGFQNVLRNVMEELNNVKKYFNRKFFLSVLECWLKLQVESREGKFMKNSCLKVVINYFHPFSNM